MRLFHAPIVVDFSNAEANAVMVRFMAVIEPHLNAFVAEVVGPMIVDRSKPDRYVVFAAHDSHHMHRIMRESLGTLVRCDPLTIRRPSDDVMLWVTDTATAARVADWAKQPKTAMTLRDDPPLVRVLTLVEELSKTFSLNLSRKDIPHVF